LETRVDDYRGGPRDDISGVLVTPLVGSPRSRVATRFNQDEGSGRVTSHRNGGIFRQALFLTVVVTVGWIVCFWPARIFGGDSGVLWMSIAAGACLGPGWFVVFLSGLAVLSSDLSVMLVQTMVRLMSVSVVALIVKKTRPELGFVVFFGWLVGFYLLALVTEVCLLFRERGRVKSSLPVAEGEDSNDLQ
jgi:hypothetical protein